RAAGTVVGDPRRVREAARPRHRLPAAFFVRRCAAARDRSAPRDILRGVPAHRAAPLRRARLSCRRCVVYRRGFDGRPRDERRVSRRGNASRARRPAHAAKRSRGCGAPGRRGRHRSGARVAAHELLGSRPAVAVVLWRAVLRRTATTTAIALIGACALAGYWWLASRPRADPQIRADGYNYYLYAASWIVYHDATLEALPRDWNGGAYPAFAGMVRVPETDHWLNRHPIGVSVLMLPFVVVADLLTRWSNFPRDAFSFYYQHAAGLAGIAYFLGGLIVLRRTLRRSFSEAVTAATLVGVSVGTNLFHYAVYDGTFSHAYSFALAAALVELTDNWWTTTTPSTSTAAAIGVVSGLIVLVRHPNAVLLLLVPLWRARTARDVWRRRRDLLLMAALGLVCVFPQLAYYRWVTQHWIVNAYASTGLRFTFLTPHLFGVLFSTERGLFFWSPLLLFAVAGFVVARGWARHVRFASIVVLTLNAWIIASWSEWQYGASYGHRAFIDSLPIVAIFLAAFFAWVAERPRLVPLAAAAASAAIALSVTQMIQYWLGIWPTRDITWEQYRSLFLTFQ